MKVHVVATEWARHGDEMRRIRERVFVEEQGVPRTEEWDGRDDDAVHFVALNEAGQALGTARLLPTGQIGRMAVLREHRGRGIGRQLLDAAVATATERGFDRVFLHAQVHAIEFYRRAGFDAVDGEFLEAGIPHRNMVRPLPIAFREEVTNRPARIHADPAAAAQPAPGGELTVFGDENECRTALLAILATARRNVSIVSPTLDKALFATPACVDLLSRFARSAPATRVRILVEDTRGIAESGHRLLELARRLPSKIEIRRLPEDLPEPVSRSFALADDHALWVVPERDDYAGFAHTYDRVETLRLADEFDRLFNRSAEDPALRRLTL